MGKKKSQEINVQAPSFQANADVGPNISLLSKTGRGLIGGDFMDPNDPNLGFLSQLVTPNNELVQAQLGLAQMQPVKGRTNIKRLTPAIRLIDDSYNANVESVKAAIDLLASYSGYRILLLGDMAELGENARLYHEEIGLYAKQSGTRL